MEACFIDVKQAVEASHEVAEVSQPSIGSFDLPAFAVASEWASILSWLAHSVCLVGYDQFDATLAQAHAKRVAVIGLVGNQPLRFLPWAAAVAAVRGADRGEGDFGEFDFRRRGRSQVLSHRKTLAIDHHHPLCTLAAPGFSDPGAPFFAEAKLPSMNASLQSRCPFRFNSPRKVRQIVNQTPRCSQSCRRRQQVAGDRYSAGRSCRLAPLRAIHKMPSSTRPISPGTPAASALAQPGKQRLNLLSLLVRQHRTASWHRRCLLPLCRLSTTCAQSTSLNPESGYESASSALRVFLPACSSWKCPRMWIPRWKRFQ